MNNAAPSPLEAIYSETSSSSSSSNVDCIFQSVVSSVSLAVKIEAANGLADALDESFRSGSSPIGAASIARSVFLALYNLSMHADVNVRIAAGVAIEGCMTTFFRRIDATRSRHTRRSTLAELLSRAIGITGASKAEVYASSASSGSLVSFATFDMGLVLSKGSPLLSGNVFEESPLSSLPASHGGTGVNSSLSLAERLAKQRSAVLSTIGLESISSVDNRDRACATAETVESSTTVPGVATAIKLTRLETVNDEDLISGIEQYQKRGIAGNSTSSTTSSASALLNSTSAPPQSFSRSSVRVESISLDGEGDIIAAAANSEIIVLFNAACFHLFDACWGKRHGAVLMLRGILLSMLQFSCSVEEELQRITDLEPQDNGYAALEDLILRLTCVLALDRFSDFGSRSLVSVVREASAQALSLAAARLPNTRLMRVIAALQLVSTHKDWHARHGSVLGLKATVSLVLRSHSVFSNQTRKQLSDAGCIAVTLLSDNSDDVSSVAGELLLRIVQSQASILGDPQIGRVLQSCSQRLDHFINSGRSDVGSDASISPLPPVLLSLLRSLLSITLIENHIHDELIQKIFTSASIFVEHSLSSVRIDAISILIRMCELELPRTVLTGPQFSAKPSRSTGRKRERVETSLLDLPNAIPFSVWWNQDGFLRLVSASLRYHVLEMEDDLEVDLPADGHVSALTFLISSTVAPKLLVSGSKSLVEDDISRSCQRRLAFQLIGRAFELDKNVSINGPISAMTGETENRARAWFINSLSAFAMRDGDALQASQLRPPSSSGDFDSTLSLSPAFAINFRKRSIGTEILAYLLAGNGTQPSKSSFVAATFQKMSLNEIALSLRVLAESSSSTSAQTVALLTSAFWRFVDLKKISPPACQSVSQILEPLLTFFRLPSDMDVDRAPIVEANSSFLELSIACGDLYRAIGQYNSEKKRKRGVQKKSKVELASESLIELNSVARKTEQAIVEAQALINENKDLPTPALLEEVVLQTDRTRRFLQVARNQTLRWCVPANVCIAAALFAPALRIARSLGSSHSWGSCIPQRITPLIRSLIDGAGCGVSLDARLIGLWVPAFSASVLTSLCSACWLESSSSSERDFGVIGSTIFDKIASAVVRSENTSAAASLSLVTLLQQQGCTKALNAVCDALTPKNLLQGAVRQPSPFSSLISLPITSTFVLAACVIVASELVDEHTILNRAASTAMGLLPIAFKAFIHDNAISPTAIVLTCAVASLRFHKFAGLVAEHLLPVLLSPHSSSDDDARQRERILMLIHCSLQGSFKGDFRSTFLSSSRTLLVDRRNECLSLREILARYGACLFPAAVSCLAHNSEAVRRNASSLLRLLVDSLPVFSKTVSSKTDVTLDMNDHLVSAFRRGEGLKNLLEQGARRSFERLPPSVAKVLIADHKQGNDDKNSLESNEHLPSSTFCLPEGVYPNGIDLRPYQLEGIEWMSFLQENNLGGILADDMGLGKTAQTLVAIATAVHRGDLNFPPVSVIVCPATLVHHWSFEVEKLYGKDGLLNTIVYSGNHQDRLSDLTKLFSKSVEAKRLRVLDSGNKEVIKPLKASHTILITSFSMLRIDIDKICRVSGEKGFAFLIIDEAHAASNPSSALFSCLQTVSFKSRHRFCLSGTPVQNKPEDLWALLSLALPGALGTLSDFKTHIAAPVRKARSPLVTEAEIVHARQALAALQRQALPFVLRRLKGDVLSELPPKTITDIVVDLAPMQMLLHNMFLESLRQPTIEYPLQNSMFALQTLRHIVNHPNCLDEPLRTSLLRSTAIPPAGQKREKRSRSDPLQASSSQIAVSFPIHESCKLIALGNLLRRLGLSESGSTGLGLPDSTSDPGVDLQDLDHGVITNSSTQIRKILIFAQQPRTLNAIEKGLLCVYFPTVGCSRIDGSVQASSRVGLANQFNNDPRLQLMLLTTAVGGLGLNLTGADTVIFYDHDWNPFKDLQAMDRAHRLGQKNTVNVYRLLTRGTFEERVMTLQRFKITVADSAIGSGSSAHVSHGRDIRAFRAPSASPETDEVEQGDNQDGYDEGAIQSMSLDAFLNVVSGIST
jgi:SNF2 family DNA or RNA helicase